MNRLIYGPFIPDLENRFQEDLLALRRGDPLRPVQVLVGSNLLSVFLRRRLAWAGQGLAGVRFLTFLDLAGRLGEESLLQAGRRPRPPLGDLLATAAALKWLPEAGYHSTIADLPGFLPALATTLKELHEAGLTGEEDWPAEPRWQELRLLLKDYRARLAPYYGSGDLLRAAAEMIRGGRVDPGPGPILVYGVYDWNLEQGELLSALAQKADCRFYFPYEERPGYAYARTRFEEARGWGLEPEPAGRPARVPAPPTSLDLLKERLFEPMGEGSDPIEATEPAVTLIAAPDQVAEAEAVGREIRRLAGEGVPFREMAVLARGLDSYGGLVQRVFERFDVPFALLGGPGFDRTPAGRAFTLLLELAAGGYPRAAVVEWLGYWQDGQPLWDALTREAGIVSGEDDWRRRLKEAARSWRDPAKAAAAGDLLERVAELFARIDAWRQATGWRQWLDGARRLVEAYWPADQVTPLIEQLVPLAELDEMGGEADWQAYTRAARLMLQKGSPTGTPFQEGVLVTDVMRARGLHFDTVFLLGLNERVFPAVARQDPLLPDADRARFNRTARRQGLVLKRERPLEERLLFELAVAAADQRLFLTYARTEPETGRPRVPSYFLLRAAEALSGRRVSLAEIERLPFTHRLPAGRWQAGQPAEAADRAEWTVRYGLHALEEGQPSALLALAETEPFLRRALLAEVQRWGSDRFTEYDCMVGPGLLAPDEQPLGVSRLETYARCPYRFFLQYVIGIEELEEPDEVLVMEPLERGTLVHEVLEKGFRRMQKEGLLPLTGTSFPEARRVLQEEFATAFASREQNRLAGRGALARLERELLEEDLQETLYRLLLEGASFVPADFELSFGGLEVVLPDEKGAGRLLVRGKIDRLDRVSGGGYRVVDYKTGRLPAKDGSLAGGEALQLPLYLLAAAEQKGVEPGQVEARYEKVSGAGRGATVSFTGKNWSDRQEELREVLGTIAEGLARGFFFPHPGPGAGNCTYCPVRPACPTAVDLLYEMKQEDDRIGGFRRMKEVE